MSLRAHKVNQAPLLTKPDLQLVTSGPEEAQQTPKEAALAIAGTFRAKRVKFEDRDAAFAHLRRESVAAVLVGCGVKTSAEVMTDDFKSDYRAAEMASEDLRGDRLIDLADKYEEHPFDLTMGALQRELSKSQFAAQAITMRRAGMILLEQSQAE
jgi:hypothetical protein